MTEKPNETANNLQLFSDKSRNCENIALIFIRTSNVLIHEPECLYSLPHLTYVIFHAASGRLYEATRRQRASRMQRRFFRLLQFRRFFVLWI